MVKKVGILLLFFYGVFIIKAQDFIVPFSLSGASDHFALNRLSDSSLVSFSEVAHLSKISNIYDSVELHVVRYNKRGDILYFKKIVLSSGFSFGPNDMTVSGNKVFLAGAIVNDSTGIPSALLMRLDECLEVEKYLVFKNRMHDGAIFTKLFSFTDSSIMALGPYFVESDTVFMTIFSMNHEFGIDWQTTVMGMMSDVALTDKNIHLWGHGYYPRKSDITISDLKLNHIILDLNGIVQSQFVKDEHEDFYISAGIAITKPSHNRFLIANEGFKLTGKTFNGLRKMKPDGTLIKSVQLNDNNNEEGCGGLCRINDNRYLALGGTQIDFSNITSMVYLVDSNLNVIRKKQILPGFKLVELCPGRSPIPFNDGALLYGRIQDGISGNPYKGLLYKIDTFLNVMKKPSITGFKDTLCLNPISGQIALLPKADTVWLDDLNLRKTIKLGVDEPYLKQNEIKVFPNPSKGDFKISFDNIESGNIIIYNTLGQLILSKEFDKEKQLNLHIPDKWGVYFIQIKTGEYTVMRKLVIE